MSDRTWCIVPGCDEQPFPSDDSLKARIKALEAENTQLHAQLQWCGEAVEGLDVSEFAESFPLVRAVADLKWQVAALEAENQRLREERDEWQQNSEWNFKRLESANKLYGDALVRLAASNAHRSSAEAEREALREAILNTIGWADVGEIPHNQLHPSVSGVSPDDDEGMLRAQLYTAVASLLR